MSRNPKTLDRDDRDDRDACPLPDHGKPDAASPCCRPKPVGSPGEGTPATKRPGWWRSLIQGR